ncbi:MAG TPA: MBOAT family protein [Candidatus Acidoferrum sp.]|nr:MBOAT family protein [Candidatus Acidoferrum sp.]
MQRSVRQGQNQTPAFVLAYPSEESREPTVSEVTLEPEVFAHHGGQRRQSIAWAPLILLPLIVGALRAKLVPWVFMWLLAAAIFAGCKWQTWWQTKSASDGAGNWKRSVAYLLLWAGMDAEAFLAAPAPKRVIAAKEWFAGIAKTLTGVALVCAGARTISAGHPVLGGWTGMVGLVLVLHFGTCHLVALGWQRTGLPVKPIMQRPFASRSLTELWGKRWNLGFRKLSHAWVFQPLQRRLGTAVGTLGAFLASGLLHDLVISVPARAGYGLPTAYFLVQGFGVLFERSEVGKRFGLGQGARGWAWTALLSVGPVYALFHPWFVMRVMVPFLGAVAG